MGHQLPIVPRFRTALGAKRALKKADVGSLPELMDKYFPRIPAAEKWVGDIGAFPGDQGFEALMVYGQLRAFIGKHEDAPDFQFMRVSDEGYRECLGAWRL